MASRNKVKNKKARERESKRKPRLVIPEEIRRVVWATLLFLTAFIVLLAFFKLAGVAGEIFMTAMTFLLGRTVFVLPLLLVLGGITVFTTAKKHFLFPTLLAILLALLGADGLLGTLAAHNQRPAGEMGGWMGYLLSWLPLNFFGIWVSLAIFAAMIALGVVIVWQLARKIKPPEDEEGEEKTPVFKKIFVPQFKIKTLDAEGERADGSTPISVLTPSPNSSLDRLKAGFKVKPTDKGLSGGDDIFLRKASQDSACKLPPLDLLESDHGQAQSGDIKVNSAIIKRTLENFDIPVEISEVSVGPTVTQYAVKPAEGIKLSKIVGLSNDLALALAAHPVRIEAPIPGRSLVGIEIPNRVRAQVRLRNLLENSLFQQSQSHLAFALGRDVAGNPLYADLARMPHLLLAGSTGTGKTIGLNAIVASLLYQNTPDTMRLILVDPKRVEFPVYNDLPHLLTPVIYDAQKTVSALKWLVSEMERRFGVLSGARTRDVLSYNQLMIKEQGEIMPYIILIVDELADLMAAKGREIEAGVVRLAQMARAVGIHLILATQRPSVEVITGLIKANITSRMAFQVASQVDSRTILDISGAEKLLGLGDMLFMSAEISKPKRIQGAYVTEKEVRKVVKFIASQAKEGEEETDGPKEKLAEDLEKTLESSVHFSENGDYFGGDDPLYGEAKKLIIETRKASASFLQRRLRVGYARAARLIDMLEEKGVVGPGEGAKPRDVLYGVDGAAEVVENEEGWKKI